MPRPRAKELTERELEIMHVFWQHGELTAQAVRDQLAADGRDLAYTTVATLIRILAEKNFIEQTNDQRPFHLPAHCDRSKTSRAASSRISSSESLADRESSC